MANWYLIGMAASGIGFLCDRMAEKEAEKAAIEQEIEHERQYSELKRRIQTLEAKLNESAQKIFEEVNK